MIKNNIYKLPTLSYKPTHQPNAPDHVSLPRLAPTGAMQREEAKARSDAQRKIKGRQTGGERKDRGEQRKRDMGTGLR